MMFISSVPKMLSPQVLKGKRKKKLLVYLSKMKKKNISRDLKTVTATW